MADKRETIRVLQNALFEEGRIDKDVTKNIPHFMKYAKNGLDLSISFSAKLDKDEELEWAFDCIKAEQEDKYDAAGYGWDDEDKRMALSEEGARFLLIRDNKQDNALVGIVHFRFSVVGEFIDQMVGDTCLLLWDIYLEPEVRRKKLGKHLLCILEVIARQEGIAQVSIPIMIDDQDTDEWIASMKGYSADANVKTLCNFDKDMEGFEIVSKIITVAPKSTSSALTSGDTLKEGVPKTVLTDITNNAVSGTGAADGNEKEAAPENDNILKDVDMNQALESLKALYLEKHGRDADSDMVTHWREELSQATHA